MKLKKLATAVGWGACILLVLGLTELISRPLVYGNGIAETELRAVPGFGSVEVSSAIDFDLIVGPEAGLEVITDANIMPHVVTEVSGDRLRIYVNATITSGLGVKVRAMTPAVKSVSASGASTTKLQGVHGKQFRLAVSGASKCAMTGNPDRLDVKLSGASTCSVTGSAERLAVECSGASRLQATELAVQTVKATASGASRVEVMAMHELSARASGASTVRYAGQPATLRQRSSGGSTISSR